MAWATLTGPTRKRPVRPGAIQALADRGEPGSISAWRQQYTAQADKAEAAIAAEHQAAIETGQPWPPGPAHFGPAPEPAAKTARHPAMAAGGDLRCRD